MGDAMTHHPHETVRDRTAARLLAGLVGLIITPFALLMIGSNALTMIQFRSMSRAGQAQLPIQFYGALVLIVVGSLLVLLVVASGMFSSAGPLIGGFVWGLLPGVVAFAPAAYLPIAQSGIDRSLVDGYLMGFTYPIALALFLIGLALVWLRRTTPASRGASMVALVVSLIAGVAAFTFTVLGYAAGLWTTLTTLKFDPSNIVPAGLALVAAVVLYAVSIACARFTSWATVPAGAVFVVLGFALAVLPPRATVGLYQLFPGMGGSVLDYFGATGSLMVLGVVFIAFALVAYVVRRTHGGLMSTLETEPQALA
jgi:hypothetical protein